MIALVLAVYVTNGLWRDPYRHGLSDNIGDQAWFEWLLGYGVYMLSNGADPYFTHMMNAPLGVNLAANTSITVYTVLFAPLTHLAGPQVTFVTILTLNLAGSAFAWYLFFRRWLAVSPFAAGLAGLFCGFAPGFVAHANGHLNWSAGWVAPFVLWRVMKLREEGRWLRNGLLLGLALAIGFSVAPEGLFYVAIASGIFIGVWSCAKAVRHEALAAFGTVVKALAVAAAVAGVLLAYPLYMHFGGPQTFSGTGFNQRFFVEDVAAYLSYASRSLGALVGLGSDLGPNRTEETSFFGVPLMILMVVAFVMLWRRADPGRRATLRAVGVTGLAFLILSWGPRLNFAGGELPIPLPYAALAHLPLFDAALPLRFALAVVGVFGILLALLVDKIQTFPRKNLLIAALAVSLVPIFPLPLRVQERSPEPDFISNGTWQQYVSENGVLSALPFALNVHADGQRWQAYTMARGGAQFRIPDGYFLGPMTTGEEGKKQMGRIGAPPLATDWLFTRAALYGYVPRLTNADRIQARFDFRYWGVEAVFLPDEITGSDHKILFRSAVLTAATDLLGEPERVDDVLLWRIRPGVDPVDR
ncbi:glycosyl transferase [Actinoplanes sp. OR16]|nr:glycosyl transferase [Actinoplanes sp. OR16]